MSEYAQRFAENRIAFSVLPDLTDNDLKDLGVVLGDRRKILRAIATLGATPETVVPAPKPSSTLSVATVQSVRIAEESSELLPRKARLSSRPPLPLAPHDPIQRQRLLS